MKTIKKCLIPLFAIPLILQLTFLPVFAREMEVAETDEVTDLTFTFTFDVEIIELSLISPSGVEITSSSDGIYYNEGDLYCVFVVYDAEPGIWYVSYDGLGNNTDIDYVVINAKQSSIIINDFVCQTDDDGCLYFDFQAEYSGSSDGTYQYTIYAVNAETYAYYALLEGTGVNGESVSTSITPTFLEGGDYYFELEVNREIDGSTSTASVDTDEITYNAVAYDESTAEEAEVTEETSDETASDETETESSETVEESTATVTDDSDEESEILELMQDNAAVIALVFAVIAGVACFYILKNEY